MRDHLEALGDEELLLALSAIGRCEREVTCEWLAHLGELDARRLHEDLGFTSLWEFCTKRLGICQSTAGRRIAAARVCRGFPEALALVASGALGVTVLSLLQKHLCFENAAELFAMCSGRSLRDAEELLAARFPKPDVRDSVRRLPAGAGATPSAGSGGGAGSTRLEPLSEGRFSVRFTASTAFRDLLERVRALASHRLPGGDLETLMQRGLEAHERELLKQRFAVGKELRAPRRVAKEGKASHTRHIESLVRREVHERDGGRCTFVSPEGRRCEARHFLELDHVEPFAVGGAETVDNLRLRCGAHNRWAARRYSCTGT